MSRHERSGWRDEALSLRHREWGYNCPCVDLDFLVVEYNLGLPVALVEYKHFLADEPDTRHPTYKAITKLADGHKDGPLPFYIARYWPDIWAFRLWPVNDKAKSIIKPGQWRTERQYVNGLYQLRARKLEDAIACGDVRVGLFDALPDEAMEAA